METVARDPLVGRLVGQRYQVLGRVARGGMATVYRAEDTRLGRLVALKVMHPHLAESADFVARFQHEARAAASLSHPAVVAVHDAGGDGTDEPLWLAMELLPGRTLRDELRARGGFSPAETFEVVQPVLLALAEAHAAGLVHRDVKPENVLRARDGSWKVADFGLARAASSSRTATGTLLGTPEYLAPETAQTGQVDERVDVYSAGILLFELLTGRQPHTGDVPFQVVWAHVTSDVPPPSRWAPGLPAAVDGLVAEACERDPEQRTPTASGLLSRVRRVWAALDPDVLDSRPLPAGPAVADGTTGVIPRGGPRPRPTDRHRPDDGPLDDHALDDLDDHDLDDHDLDDHDLDDHDLDGGPGHPDAGWQQVLGAHPSARADLPEEDDGDGRSDTAVLTARRRRRRPGMGAVLLVLLLLSVVGAAGLWWTEAGPGAQREVPDLRGRTAEAGAAQLDAIGIGSSTTPVFDDVAPEGEVVDTRPAPGGSVHKNGSVVLVVSAGPELFAVPDLRGRTQEEAAAELERARLALGAVTEAYDPQVEPGQVVSAEPAAGQQVREGTTVAVVLSLGPQPVDVPALAGLGLEEARAALEGAGLRLGEQGERYDDAAAGTVVAQDPGDGTLLPGGTVDVVLSLGPEPVEVPAVFERRFDEAAAALEELGFVVERRGSDIFGRVVSQDPPAGTELVPGSTVVLTTF